MTGLPPISVAALLQSGLANHREGRLDEADRLYRQVLAHQPRQQDALRLLGVLNRQRGDLQAARELLELALEIAPHLPDTHHDLGLVWFELHEYREAIAAYQRALALCRDFPEAHYNLGNAYYALGERDHAEASYLEAINQQPNLAEVHFNLGLLEQDRRNDSAAITHYADALRIRPQYPEAFLNRGLSQTSLGDLKAATSSFREALALRPDYLEAWLNLGDVLQRSGALAEAESCFRRVIELQPSSMAAHLNLSMVLNSLGRSDEAGAAARSAVLLAPWSPRAHAYLGALLLKKNQIDEAIDCSNRALSLDPDFIPARVTLSQSLLLLNKLPESARECEAIIGLDGSNVPAHTCLGLIRSRQRRPWEALAALEQAVSLSPADSEAIIHLAISELLLGRFASGWKHYEARWTTEITSCVPRRLAQPLWKGEPLAGRTLLLYGEQGFGDTIQFSRYAKLAASQGGRVIIECQPALKCILRTVAGASQVVGYGEPLPSFDLHAPLLSLPGIFQTTLEAIPSAVPYLSAPADVFTKLPVTQGGDLKIGLAWCGSQSQNHDPRPVPLNCLQPILNLKGIDFYSFQKGDAAGELRHLSVRSPIHDLSHQLKDFSVTASFVEQLDLVLSIDTALAHLAGAMGKPVWVMLPFAPDWRWTLEGEHCPWYPTMRLFRQTKANCWRECADRVALELRSLAEKRT